MVFQIHRNKERGVAEHGWLHSRFSFSFAHYFNPNRMGFGALRVINDDVVEAGEGFGMHPHKDMEIISIVTKGALKHKDSEGNQEITKAGEIQYMSAGRGIMHSEFATNEEDVALYQIWIHPAQANATPLYDKRDFANIDQKNRWAVLVSGSGADESMKIRQDATIYATALNSEVELIIPSTKESHGRLLFVMEGSVSIDGQILYERDEIQITDWEEHSLKALAESKVLLFVVPMH
jgi:redox-sensitive bicupin YhaK (pirin superfamily)